MTDSLIKMMVLFCVLSVFASKASAVAVKAPLEFKNYVLLIDVSGSMEGRGDGKGDVIFPKVKKAINGFIETEISNGSKVKVVGFGERILINKEFVINEPLDKKLIYSFIDELEAVGKNTNIYGTLDYALKEAEALQTPAPFMILLFTDGIENVNEKSIVDLLDYFQELQQMNPFLFVYYYHLTTKSNPDLEKLGENFIVKKFDPNSDYFQEQLAEILKQSKLSTESRLEEINEKHQAFLSAKADADDAKAQAEAAMARATAEKLQAETETKRAEAAKTQATTEKEQAEAKRKQAEAEVRRAHAVKLDADAAVAQAEAEKKQAVAETRRADAAKLQAEAAKTQAEAEQKKLAEQRKQEVEIVSLLAEAKALREEGSRESLEIAKQKYQSVLEIDPNRLDAIDGIKEVDNETWKLMGHFEKYWYFYLIALFVLMFLALVLRYLLATNKPAPIVYRFSYCLDGQSDEPDFAMDIFFPRKLFEKVGAAKFIGSESGDIMIEHSAVSSTRHARMFRSRGVVMFEQEHGYIYDLLGAQQSSIVLSDDDSFYLGAANCDSLERDGVKIQLQRIS